MNKYGLAVSTSFQQPAPNPTLLRVEGRDCRDTFKKLLTVEIEYRVGKATISKAIAYKILTHETIDSERGFEDMLPSSKSEAIAITKKYLEDYGHLHPDPKNLMYWDNVLKKVENLFPDLDY